MALLCYISSTFSDLENERKLVFDWLAKQTGLYTPVNSEAQSPDLTLKTCFDDIQRCEVYILLLGARYGTRADSQYGEDLSYTHHEFKHAKELGKQCYAFQIKASEAWDDVSNSDNDSRKNFWKEVKSYKKVSADKLIDELSTSLNRYAHGSWEEGISGLVPQPPPNESAKVVPISSVNSLEAMPAIQAALMIQLKDTGASGADGNLFEFDAELFIESSTPERVFEAPWALLYQDLSLDIEPKENKLFGDLGPYIAECWDNAEAKLYKLKTAGTIPAYKLHVEIFTCRIAMNENFGRLVIPIQPSDNGRPSQRPARTKYLLSMPFLLRSWDRLSADCSVKNNLEYQWSKTNQPVTQAIATCKCPYVEGQSDASNPQDRLESFYTRLESYPAHFHLPALPRDKDNKDELFDEIVWSGIPIALWWANIRSTSIQILLQRSKLLFEQLAGEGLPNQLKAEVKEDSSTKNEATKNETGKETEEETEDETVEIYLQLSNLMMHYLAIRRRDLFTRYPDWIPDLVLLIDCPDRYPKKFQTQQPQFSQS
jgi:hypothetical protein